MPLSYARSSINVNNTLRIQRRDSHNMQDEGYSGPAETRQVRVVCLARARANMGKNLAAFSRLRHLLFRQGPFSFSRIVMADGT